MSFDPKVSAIVAMAENGCIGQDNKMPWHIPADLKRFKALTMGGIIVMGRKTYESILGYLGGPLPGRTSLVVSRSGYQAAGAVTCPDLGSALEAAKAMAADQGLDEILIGGGAQIYEAALPVTDRIYLTRIHAVVNGDAFFPDLAPEEWRESAREAHDGDPSFSFITLDRV